MHRPNSLQQQQQQQQPHAPPPKRTLHKRSTILTQVATKILLLLLSCLYGMCPMDIDDWYPTILLTELPAPCFYPANTTSFMVSIYRCIAEFITNFRLRILMDLDDLEDNATVLQQLNKLAVIHNMALLLARSKEEEEEARYLENYKYARGLDST